MEVQNLNGYLKKLYQTINVTELKGLLVTLSKGHVGVACIEQPQTPKWIRTEF